MAFSIIWFIVSLALGALGVWYARSFAIIRNWLDYPNERSFHKNPVPRIGGIGMLAPLMAGMVVVFLIPESVMDHAWLGPLLPAWLVALLSFFDDRFELSRLIRFAGHGLCAAVVLWILHPDWAGAPLPVFGDALPVLVCALLLFVWITGLTNAYNFMDGIDGIAAMQGIVAIAGWCSILILSPFIELSQGNPQLLLLLSLVAGLLGFLILNWAPASIFMGDIGSTFLGFYLAVLPLGAAAMGLPLDRALEAGVFFVWPFVADTGLTFFRRLARRENIFDAHRSHLYQVFASTFGKRETGHRWTTLLFGALSLVGVGLYWTSGPLWAKIGVLGGLWVAVVAWTYGIRLQDSSKGGKYSSTQGKVRMEDEWVESPVVGLMPFDIYLSPPEITEAEHRRVAEALQSGFIAPVGPQVNSFEQGLARYLRLDELQALSSGTAAIHLGLRALGVGPGDVVICPDLTFIASVNPVRYLGAEPVLVDVRKENWAMDPALAREAIRTLKKEGRTVRVMVVVHAFGIPAPIEELVQLAREEGVAVLEDCAGAFGAWIGDRSVGSFGDAAAYSFNGNKVLTTSGGGALFIRNKEMRDSARSWANQGKRIGAVGYQHETLGYNYKLSNICAAIGLAQLETLERRLARKRVIFRSYRQRFAEFPLVGFMPEPEYGRNNYWLSCISLDTSTHAEELVHTLRQEGIEASPMWKPMHMQELNTDLRVFGGEASEKIHRRFLSLPSGSSLTDAELDRVSELVRKNLLVASA
ncbi:MAG: aminotransferase class V-fold PLP-dependent enzyme [Oceanipulchritudo sp.]